MGNFYRHLGDLLLVTLVATHIPLIVRVGGSDFWPNGFFGQIGTFQSCVRVFLTKSKSELS